MRLGQDRARAVINRYNQTNACYPLNFAFNPDNKNELGQFNFSTCRSLYADLLLQHQIAKQLPRIPHKQFIAYSGVYFTLNFFNADTTPDSATVGSHVQTECTKPWDEFKKSNASKAPEKYLAGYCANGAYLTELLYQTYQLKPDQLTVTNEINKQKIDWTLGAVLARTTS